MARAVRVLFLGDTHGALDARVLALAQTCELAVHAGDVGSSAVLSALREACGDVRAVRGNNDVASKWPTSDRTALMALPAYMRVELPGGLLVAEHV